MSNRTTKVEVQAVFERPCATVGVAPLHTKGAKNYYRDEDGQLHHHAGWSLDYNPTYGGWTVAGHAGVGTGEDRPLGWHRMSSRQFVQAMRFAIRAIDASRANA